jgi:hypothetical protein
MSARSDTVLNPVSIETVGKIETGQELNFWSRITCFAEFGSEGGWQSKRSKFARHEPYQKWRDFLLNRAHGSKNMSNFLGF